VEHHAELLAGRVWLPARANWRDFVALVLMVAIIVLLGAAASQMAAPLAAGRPPEISLSPAMLPN
jgi:hypothetical protein